MKKIMEYLLTEQGPNVMSRETEQVFKGFMMAYYSIIELQNKTVTEKTEA